MATKYFAYRKRSSVIIAEHVTKYIISLNMYVGSKSQCTTSDSFLAMSAVGFKACGISSTYH